MKRAIVTTLLAILTMLFLVFSSLYGQERGAAETRPSADSIASVLTLMMDLNNDGEISRTEYRKFFTNVDRDRNGSVAWKEIIELVNNRWRETGPRIDQEAPDFNLKALHGNATVKLSDFREKKPVVLVFASHAATSLKLQAAGLERLYQQYKTKAGWYLVYTREVDPADSGNKANQPKTMEELMAAALNLYNDGEIPFPILMDDIDNKTGKAYAAWPERLYVIDKKGKIAYKSKGETKGFDLTEFAQKLKKICDS